jgi:hypothetical protein
LQAVKEADKKAAEAAASAPPSPPVSKPPKVKKAEAASTSSSDTLEYDDEDAKIIAETKAKGYCYFKKQPSSDDAKIIGDNRPTTITSSTSLDSAPASVSGVAASSWNAAGTWEERNTTVLVKSKLKSIFVDRKFKGSNFEVSVSDVKEPDGEANIIFSKGKKKHGFDMNMTMDIYLFIDSGSIVNTSEVEELNKDAAEGESTNKRKKYKATVKISDLNITNQFEWDVSYKGVKGIPGDERDSLQTAVSLFKTDVTAAIQSFIEEYSKL